jgi:hypothetical protein
MASVSLGKVTVATPGSPVRCTANQVDPAKPMVAHSVHIQPLFDNSGHVYIGSAAMVRSTYAGVIEVIAVPAINYHPKFTRSSDASINGLNIADLYIDADVTGDSALISIEVL